MSTTLAMPQLGESVVEGTVGKWHVREGDRVEKDQDVVEILTDKSDSVIPAPAAGVITKILAAEGATVKVGQALCEIDENASAAAAPRAAAPAATPAAAPAAQVSSGASSGAASADVRSSPSVRKLARENDVDLGRVTPSGEHGRVTHDDVLRAAQGVPPTSNGDPAPARGTSPGGFPAPVPFPPSQSSAGGAAAAAGRPLAFQVPAYIPKPGDEVIKFSRRRRIIADHMVYSKLTSPHVVTVAECDLHRTSVLRDTHKAELKKEGVNLTFLSFVAAATARALRENRGVNARVLDDAFVLLRDINLGIAVDTPDGLVVPVVKGAGELTVRGLARAIDEIAKKARDGKLASDDLAGKTFTISNPGLKGNLFGGAIISQPNVGILRIGEIQKRVVIVEHDGEDLMAIRPVMHMALSYDHRIVDGVLANSFLYRVVELLESADFVI
ncbi:MAG: 2-oxo acid dehydrogenase subunit E2 [Sandaracinaceae bacterium]|nr:2-oxo acid dehydrogenase subunit E2 [Sandaracinaceae bacterium]